MAFWAHRLPLKGTSAINFAQGRLACGADNREAKELLRTLTAARTALLRATGAHGETPDSIKKCLDDYLSLLRGLVEYKPQGDAAPAAATAPAAAGAAGTTPPAASAAAGAAATPAQQAVGSANVPGTTGAVPKSDRLRVAVIYRWRDDTSGKILSFPDAQFEIGSVLFNVALAFMNRATSLAMGTADEDVAKDIYLSLRRAAGLFEAVLASEKLVPFAPSTDLDGCTLRGLRLEALAEAQEVTLERARQKQHKPELIAGIALDTSMKFEAAVHELEGVSAITAFPLRNYLTFKAQFYKAYANCYKGQAMFNEEKCGLACKYYEQAAAALQQARKASERYASSTTSGFTYRTQIPNLPEHIIFVTLEKTLKASHDKANTENGLIYHERVPAEPQEVGTPQELVKADPYVLPPISEQWLTAKFLPQNIPVKGSDTSADKAADDEAPIRDAHEPDRLPKTASTEFTCVLQ
eukprot:m.182404 g.182404  ORF g.182404 m.182404 type:complete len:468 (+) comp17459_c2_seq5:319-1722(+)